MVCLLFKEQSRLIDGRTDGDYGLFKVNIRVCKCISTHIWSNFVLLLLHILKDSIIVLYMVSEMVHRIIAQSLDIQTFKVPQEEIMQ